MRRGQHAVAGTRNQDLGEQLLRGEVDHGRLPAQVPMRHPRPLGPAELRAGLAEQQQRVTVIGEADRDATRHIVEEAQDTDHRSRVDRHRSGLVVEGYVTAGHRQAELAAGVREPPGRLGKLPHDLRILGRTEVQAVRDGDRHGPGRGHIAACFGECELRTCERVEPGIPTVTICCQRDAEAGLVGEPDHAGILGLRKHGVGLHIPVVLVGHPRLRTQIRRGDHGQQRCTQVVAAGRARQRRRVVGPQPVQVRRPAHRPVVHRPVVGERAGRHVDDDLTMPPDDKTTAVGDRSNPGGQHAPAFGDREHLGHCVRRDDREHPLLGLARQDLMRHHRGLPQRDEVEVDRHPTGATGGQACGGRLGQRTGQPRAAEVLDGDDKSALEQLQAGFDENLLGERVADLHRWSARRSTTLVEGRRRQHRHPADAVPAGLRTEQDDRVADSGRSRSLYPSDRHHPHAQGVDQRVPQIRRIEDDFPADRRQAQAVAVAADARDHPGQHPRRVGCVGIAEPERVQDGDRPGAHGQDVADNPADAGRRTLVGLDETRVIM